MRTKGADRKRREARGPGRSPKRSPRFLPRPRWARILIYLAVIVGYAAILWFYVFPWADRTFVNQPAL